MAGTFTFIDAFKCAFGIKETETNKEKYKRPIHYLNEALGATAGKEKKTTEFKRPIHYLYEALAEQELKAS